MNRLNKVVMAKELAINFYSQGMKNLTLQDECLSLYGEYIENPVYILYITILTFHCCVLP